MNIVLWILTWLGNLSIITAACCLAWHIVMEIYAVKEKKWDKVVAMDDSGWLGLAYLGVWMACTIGKIWS